jgi:hypothetical protein
MAPRGGGGSKSHIVGWKGGGSRRLDPPECQKSSWGGGLDPPGGEMGGWGGGADNP